MNRSAMPRQPPAPGRTVEVVVAGVAAATVVVAAWVWLSGQLAAWLARGRWPGMPVWSTGGVVVRLPSHLGDPSAAWPEPIRADLPGAALLYGCGLLLLVAVLALGSAAHWVVLWSIEPQPAGRRRVSGAGKRQRRGRIPGAPRWGHGRVIGARRARWVGGARWAAGSDLRELRVRRGHSSRLVLGGTSGLRRGRTLLATEARHSVLVVGPTQSGKTSGLAVPALLEWRGPAIATSVKDDLAATTLAWRGQQGPCWVFDPTGTSGLRPQARWSPLAVCRDWSGAQRVAGWLVDATPARSGMADAAFWYAAAAKQLAPLLLAAERGGMGMADVVRWTNAGVFDEPTRLLELSGEADAAMALAACEARDPRIQSSVATTLETVLAPFEDPIVASCTAGSEIDPEALLSSGGTLYLCGPSHEQHRVQGLFAALVSAAVSAAVRRVNDTGRSLDPPLLLVLDEAANIAPLRDLDTLASTGAGMGVQLVTVCQDLAQLGARYGPERSRTIANNHRAKVLLSGVSDIATLDLLSGLAGEAAVQEETLTHDLRDGRRTRSSAVALRRLAPTDQLRRIPPGEGVLIYGHLPPVRLHLRPWFGDRRLRARVEPRPNPPRQPANRFCEVNRVLRG
jgi:type IV secretion system protein VirD4